MDEATDSPRRPELDVRQQQIGPPVMNPPAGSGRSSDHAGASTGHAGASTGHTDASSDPLPEELSPEGQAPTADDYEPHPRAIPALLLGMVCISFAAILIRWTGSQALLVGAYRMTLGTLLFVPLVVARYREELAGLWRHQRLQFLEMALVGVVLGFHFAFFISAVKLTSVAAAVLLATCHPLFVAPAGQGLFNERVTPMALVGIPLAFGGVVMLIWGSHELAIGSLEGNLLGLAGGLAAGIYYLAGRRVRKRVSLPVYALVVYCFSALTLWVLVLGFEPADTWLVTDGREWVVFALLALIPTLGGHTMQNWALRHVPAYGVSVTLLGEPIGAVLLAIPLLGEWPAWVELAGGAVILAGIGLTLLGSGRPAADPLRPPPPPGPTSGRGRAAKQT